MMEAQNCPRALRKKHIWGVLALANDIISCHNTSAANLNNVELHKQQHV